MAYDFSLNNPEIKDWFQTGKGPVPVRHFIYLHEHPLVRPNFITEIEILIHNTGVHSMSRNITGAVITRFVAAAEAFTETLRAYVVSKDEADAAKVVESLRTIYKVCNQIQSL